MWLQKRATRTFSSIQMRLAAGKETLLLTRQRTGQELLLALVYLEEARS